MRWPLAFFKRLNCDVTFRRMCSQFWQHLSIASFGDIRLRSKETLERGWQRMLSPNPIGKTQKVLELEEAESSIG